MVAATVSGVPTAKASSFQPMWYRAPIVSREGSVEWISAKIMSDTLARPPVRALASRSAGTKRFWISRAGGHITSR